MILSDAAIKEALEKGDISIEPMPGDDQYKPSALDLHFDGPLYRYRTAAELGAKEPGGAERPVIINPLHLDSHALVLSYGEELARDRDGSYILEPEQFALGRTLERICLNRESLIAARVEGRSSLARLGLVVHLTAPTIHNTFRGHITLEIRNFGPYPIRLKPRELKICQLVFERLDSPASMELRSSHQGQDGPA